MHSVLYACLLCINFNKYIHTLIKQTFDDVAIRCTFVKLSICVYAYICTLTLFSLSLYWVLEIPGRH